MTTPNQMFINGKFVESSSKARYETYNPATEKVICTLPLGNEDDVDAAVHAATTALKSGPWATMSARDRGAILLKLADVVKEHEEELGHLETLDGGFPISQAKNLHLADAIAVFRYFGGWADKIQGKVISLPNPDAKTKLFAYTRREPVGVIGAITPWNYPIDMMSWKIAPALAAGNTIVHKPAQNTSLTALKIAELLRDKCGLPEGVLNIVTGDGPTLGSHMTVHPNIDKIAFTGSTRVGKLIQKRTADTIKRVTLELGGKSPVIVFKDANIDNAVSCSVWGAILNMGQNCNAGSRTYVEAAIYDEFVAKSVAFAKNIKLGDTFDPATEHGCQNNKENFERVLHYIDVGKKEGARVALGGQRLGTQGYFIQPTIFADCTDDMTIIKEEIFGPVMSIVKFSGDVDEAIARANGTNYGLAGGVFTSDINKALKVVDNVRAGTMWINTYNLTDTAAPFGGFKQSGFGRDLSEHALDAYTEVKAVIVASER